MLAKAWMIITSLYVRASDGHHVHLKPRQCYLSIISQQSWKNINWKNKNITIKTKNNKERKKRKKRTLGTWDGKKGFRVEVKKKKIHNQILLWKLFLENDRILYQHWLLHSSLLFYRDQDLTVYVALQRKNTASCPQRRELLPCCAGSLIHKAFQYNFL